MSLRAVLACCGGVMVVLIVLLILSQPAMPSGGERLRPIDSRALTPPAGDGEWLSYGADDQLTNHVESTGINPRSVRTLGIRWQQSLDGWVAGSPLVALVALDGKPRRLLYVGTESGSLSAFLADSGKPLWSRSLGTVTLPQEGCGAWGVSSTPAIDKQRGLIYVIGASGMLHGLDLASGAEAPGFPIPITEARDTTEYVWGGLRIVGSELLVPVASYCDAPDASGVAAEGRLLAIDLGAKTVAASWDPVPGYGNLGGIWGYGGVSVEPGRNYLYTGVGNAWVHDPTCDCWRDDAGYGDKLVKLTFPDLHPVSADRPGDVPTDFADDDFGAAPVLFRPQGCPSLAAMNNKTGVLYLWDRTRIEAGPVTQLALSDGAIEFLGAPAWSPALRMLFESDVITWKAGGVKTGYGVSGLRIAADCRLHEVWRQHTGYGNQPPPIVVGNVLFTASGSGGFSAFDARSGRPLWHMSTGTHAAIAPPIEVSGVFYAVAGSRLFALAPGA